MLAILDYGAGNQTSVKRAFEHLGISCEITATPEKLLSSAGIVFPGVGAAAQAMRALAAAGADKAILDAAGKKRPILGICLGCQIMLKNSEEENTQTLGLLPGASRRFNPAWRDGDVSIRIPHMGWNSVKQTMPDKIWEGIPDSAQFYFVHSYYTQPDKRHVLGSTTYGREFCSVYKSGNILGAQFHPEKSGRHGLRFLENFYRRCLEQGQ